MSDTLIDAKHLEAQGGLLQAALKDPKFRALILTRFTEVDFHGADRELFRIVKENSPFVPDKLSGEANARLLDLEGKLRTLPAIEDVQRWMGHLENTRALISQRNELLKGLEAIRPGVDAKAVSGTVVSGIAQVMSNVTTQTTYTMDNIVDGGLGLAARWAAGDTYAGMVSTGIAELDRETGGLMPEHITTIGAPPSQAKTVMGLQILRNVALRSVADGLDKMAIFLSLDMSPTMLGFRLASAASGVNWKDVRYNRPNVKRETWLDSLKGLRTLPLTVKKMPNPTPSQLMNEVEMEAAAHRDGISLIVVDFIELMRGEGSTESAQVSNIMTGLKVVAERYKCPVVALSQVSRAAMQSPARMPEKFHLKQSGMIEAISQAILMLYYPAGYQTRGQALTDQWPNEALKKQNDALASKGANFLVKIEKNRDDEVGIGVPLLFEPMYTRFGAPNSIALQRMKSEAQERGKLAA